jgi:phosphate starvation-inducible protein PhoH and related proteins
MIEAIETLRRVKGIGVVSLNQHDIVRHRLVQNIVRAYKKKQGSQKQAEVRRNI